MSAIRELLQTLALEIESVEGLLIAARAHLGDVRRNNGDAKDALAAVDAFERKLEVLKSQAAELRKRMH
jgi:hypothetical protein